MKNVSSRTWATIVYQESCSENWLDNLEQLKIPCYVSPLHDKDIAEDGSQKKPHWHVMLMFQGQKNRKNIFELVQTFQGVGAEKVEHKESYLKYLIHLNSKNKFLYDSKDVICLNGALDYTIAISENTESRYELTSQMIEFCDEYSICYFADLVDYARKNRIDWFKLLVERNGYLLWQYIKSKTFKERELNQVKTD